MAISVNKLLKKMQSELHNAHQANSSTTLRESVHSIKVLCELILEGNEGEAIKTLPTIPVVMPAPTITAPTLTTKKLNEEDANGDSLFDF